MNYGYCRISTAQQNIERQERNILAACPDAKLYREAFTGTKIDERKKLNKLLQVLKEGDTVYFDSVSRMSRDAEQGFALYEKLYQQGVNLVFLKEPQINTDTYKKALQGDIPMTGTNLDCILEGINKYLLVLAKEQIRLAFEQAEKEVSDLHQRTREGIKTAKLAGKQIGRKSGDKLTIKKKAPAMVVIREHSKTFGGDLSDKDCMKLAGISRNTYYAYKAEVLAQMQEEANQQ